MKICILGNSHAAALKLAWDGMKPEHPAVDLVFCASLRDTLSRLEVRGGALVAPDAKLARAIAHTSNGFAEIRPADFDAVLLYGLFSMPRGLSRDYSSAVAGETAFELFKTSPCCNLAEKVTKLASVPIFVSSKPVPAREPGENDDRASYACADVALALAPRLAAGRLILVPQPAQTLAGPWTTKAEYSKDSIRLEFPGRARPSRHDAADVSHMNGSYGKLYLEAFLAACREQLAKG